MSIKCWRDICVVITPQYGATLNNEMRRTCFQALKIETIKVVWNDKLNPNI